MTENKRNHTHKQRTRYNITHTTLSQHTHYSSTLYKRNSYDKRIYKIIKIAHSVENKRSKKQAGRD
jgi:hypothetical protein